MKFFSIIFLVFVSFSVSASTDCAALKSPSKRLQCFDMQSKLTSEISARKEAEKRQQEEEKLRQQEEEEQRKAAARKLQEYMQALNGPLKALKKLKSQVSVGISYRDYFAPLSEVRYEVDEFAKSPFATQNPEITKKLAAAAFHYEMAALNWQSGIRNGGKSRSIPLTDVDIQHYPEAVKSSRLVFGTPYIEYSTMLSIIWNEASREIQEIESISAKM